MKTIITKQMFQGVILQCLYESKCYAPFIREMLKSFQPNLNIEVIDDLEKFIVKVSYDIEMWTKWEIIKPFDFKILDNSLYCFDAFIYKILEFQKKEEALEV